MSLVIILADMEKAEIIKRLNEVKSLKGFARLLDDIKKDEFGSSKYRITYKQLLHFSSPKIVPNRYKTFQIKKKSGGVREINSPCYQLKIILHILNIVFKAVYTPNKSVNGFVEGRSVVSNAKIHSGHHYVFNTDLEDFFPSIKQARVWKRLQFPPFNLSIEVANVVAGLCCHGNSDGSNCVLPQGAPTSPLLTNAICDNLDRRLNGVARRFGLHYSRYADDITFSSMHNVYQKDGEFRTELIRVITDQGFKINKKKTRLQRNDERQEVTGLIVNDKVNIARKYVRDIRCILFVWERKGYGEAYSYFYSNYKRDKGHVKKGEPVMENVINGKLNYLRMVKGDNNPAYLKLLERFDKLNLPIYIDDKTDKGDSYIYVYSYSLLHFQEAFQTSINLVVSKKGNLIGKCEIDGLDKVMVISKSTQNELCVNLSDFVPGQIINSAELYRCYVTLCRAKGKNFWLISKYKMQRSRCLSILKAKVDIDHILKIWENFGLEEAIRGFKYSISGGDLNDFWPDKKFTFPPNKMTIVDGINIDEIIDSLPDDA